MDESRDLLHVLGASVERVVLLVTHGQTDLNEETLVVEDGYAVDQEEDGLRGGKTLREGGGRFG